MKKFELIGRSFDSIFDKMSTAMDEMFKSFDNKNIVDMEISTNMDLKENDNDYTLEIDATDVKKKGVKIKVKDNVIGVTLHKKTTNEKGSVTETSTVLSRTIPTDAEINGMTAILNNNKLVINIPKKKTNEENFDTVK